MKKAILIACSFLALVSLNNAMNIHDCLIDCLSTNNTKELKELLSKDEYYHIDATGMSFFGQIFWNKKIDDKIKLNLLNTFSICKKLKTRYKNPKLLAFDTVICLMTKNDFRSSLLLKLCEMFRDRIGAVIFEAIAFCLFLDNNTISTNIMSNNIIELLNDFQKIYKEDFITSEEFHSETFIFLLEKILVAATLKNYDKVEKFINENYMRKLDKKLSTQIKKNVSDLCRLIKILVHGIGCNDKKITQMVYNSSTKEELHQLIASMDYVDILVAHFKNKDYGFIHNFFASKQIIFCNNYDRNILVDFIKTNKVSKKEKKELLAIIFDGVSVTLRSDLLHRWQGGDVPLSAAINAGLWDVVSYLIECGASLDNLLQHEGCQKYYDCCIALLKNEHNMQFFIEAGDVVDVIIAEIIGDQRLAQEKKIIILGRLFECADLSRSHFDIYSYAELEVLMLAAERYGKRGGIFDTIKKEFQKKQQQKRIKDYLRENFKECELQDFSQKKENKFVKSSIGHDCIFNFLTVSYHEDTEEICELQEDALSQEIQNKKLVSWMNSVDRAYSLWSTSSKFLITEEDFLKFLKLLETCQNPMTKDSNKMRAKAKLIKYLIDTMPFNYNDIFVKIKNQQETLPITYNVVMDICNPSSNFEW